MKNPLVGYKINSETCSVCSKPANPGVTFEYRETGENPTHLQGTNYIVSYCNEHMPKELDNYLKNDLASWVECLQTPP